MRIKTILGPAIILTLLIVLAAEYKNAPGGPSDFRDAAGEQLQKAASGDREAKEAIPSPQTVEPAEWEPNENSLSPEDFIRQAEERAGVNPPEAGGGQGVTRIFSEKDPWHKRLAQLAGVNYPCTVETKPLNKNISELTLDDGLRKDSVVVKHYVNASIVNRLLYVCVHSAGREYYSDSAVKMFNAAQVMDKKFRAAGLRTLEILLVDPENMIMVTKFLKGTDMVTTLEAALRGDESAMKDVEKVGAALGKAHKNNLSVGDFNSGNCILADGEPYFIDLDRAVTGGNKGWDIALFFYHSVHLLSKNPVATPYAWSLVARKFLQGYKAGGGGAGVIKEALSRRYLAPVAPLYIIRGVRAVRQEMKKAAGEDPAPDTDEELGLQKAEG